jgi:hypothetical protein
MTREPSAARGRAVRAGAATALAFVCLGAAHAQAALPPKDFTAVAKVTKVKQVDDDTALYKQSIKSGGKKIGKAKLTLNFAKKLTMKGTWRLDEGTIKAKGRVRTKGNKSSVRIVNGTGAYKRAEGTLTFEQLTPKRVRQEFDFG